MFGKTVALKSICSMTLYHLSCTIYLIFCTRYQSLIKSCFMFFNTNCWKYLRKYRKQSNFCPGKLCQSDCHVDIMSTCWWQRNMTKHKNVNDLQANVEFSNWKPQLGKYLFTTSSGWRFEKTTLFCKIQKYLKSSVPQIIKRTFKSLLGPLPLEFQAWTFQLVAFLEFIGWAPVQCHTKLNEKNDWVSRRPSCWRRNGEIRIIVMMSLIQSCPTWNWEIIQKIKLVIEFIAQIFFGCFHLAPINHSMFYCALPYLGMFKTLHPTSHFKIIVLSSNLSCWRWLLVEIKLNLINSQSTGLEWLKWLQSCENGEKDHQVSALCAHQRERPLTRTSRLKLRQKSCRAEMVFLCPSNAVISVPIISYMSNIKMSWGQG